MSDVTGRQSAAKAFAARALAARVDGAGTRAPRARFLTLVLLGIGIAAWTPTASAAEAGADPEREEDYIRVVQTLPFTRGGRFAFAPTFALSVNDPLVQTFTVGANITGYLKDWIGITAGFHYAFDAKRSAQNGLFGQQLRPEINPMKWVGALGVEWVPVYGKFAFFNTGIVHWDAYLVGGAGVVNTDRGGITVTGEIGLGSRLFATSWLTIFVEVRDFIYNESFKATSGDKSNLINNLMFTVGVGFFFPGARGAR